MKKLAVFLFVLLFTGCDINYNLTIDDSFHENVKAVAESSYKDTDYYSEMNHMVNRGIFLRGNTAYAKKYTTKVIDDNEYFGLNMMGDFDSFNSPSHLVSYAVENYNFSKKNDVVTIDASNFIVFKKNDILDQLLVNIKCQKKVLKHNADEVNGNTYTWIIDKGNFEDKVINFSFSEKKVIDTSFINTPIGRFSIFLVGSTVLGFVVYLFVRIKFNKKNSI